MYICDVKTTQNDCCRLHYSTLLCAVQGSRDRTKYLQVILRVLLLFSVKVNNLSLKVMHAGAGAVEKLVSTLRFHLLKLSCELLHVSGKCQLCVPLQISESPIFVYFDIVQHTEYEQIGL